MRPSKGPRLIRPNSLSSQYQAGVDFELNDPFEKISDIFNSSIDPKFIPPSEAQVNYVFVIAGALGLAVTAETIATKSSCHDFISKHVDKFRKQFQQPEAKGDKRKKRPTKITFIEPGSSG